MNRCLKIEDLAKVRDESCSSLVYKVARNLAESHEVPCLSSAISEKSSKVCNAFWDYPGEGLRRPSGRQTRSGSASLSSRTSSLTGLLHALVDGQVGALQEEARLAMSERSGPLRAAGSANF